MEIIEPSDYKLLKRCVVYLIDIKQILLNRQLWRQFCEFTLQN